MDKEQDVRVIRKGSKRKRGRGSMGEELSPITLMTSLTRPELSKTVWPPALPTHRLPQVSRSLNIIHPVLQVLASTEISTVSDNRRTSVVTVDSVVSTCEA